MGSIGLYAGLVVVVLYAIFRKLNRSPLDDIRGPKAESFLTGNLRDIFQRESGEADFKWQTLYGNVVRINAALGGDMLLVTDPKALQYILQTSGYNYCKLPERRAMSRLHSGHGLVWAEGDAHKRQRKVMLPGFGAPEIKSLFPHFMHHAEEMSSKWKDLLLSSSEQRSTFKVNRWLSGATLDAIGEAAFDYDFNALENPNGPAVKAYNNLLELAFGSPSAGKIVALDLARFVPLPLIEWLQDWLPGKGLSKARESKQLTVDIAKQLVASKADELVDARGKRDIFSLLVKANNSENDKARLDEDELISAMRTVLFAGHETTSNSIGWTLLELARHPDVQRKLRQEIHDMESTVRAQGSTPSQSDIEQMPYLQAVIKEALRFHTALTHIFRRAERDNVLPLSKPIVTKSGKTLDAIPITKGTRIVLSLAGYNRDPDLWGPDVHVFRPERWLDGSVKSSINVGVYGSLLTFSGGIRACIGWRFAVHEMQAFLTELISNFEFSTTDESKRIRREMCGVILPMIDGEKGAQMPLKVSLAARDC